MLIYTDYFVAKVRAGTGQKVTDPTGSGSESATLGRVTEAIYLQRISSILLYALQNDILYNQSYCTFVGY